MTFDIKKSLPEEMKCKINLYCENVVKKRAILWHGCNNVH